VRKFILLKDQIVKLPAKPHSKGIRKHHKGENTLGIEYVNRLFLFIFMRLSSVTSINHAML